MTTRRALLTGGASALTLASMRVRAADDDWPTASSESQGVDDAALAKLLQAPGRSIQPLRGVVVVRNGFLIGEGYQVNIRPRQVFPIYSVTKSVASMLVGIAIEQGKIKSVDQTLGQLLPEALTKKPSAALNGVTLAQILSQTSGLPSDVGTSERLRFVPDLVELAQGFPLAPAEPLQWRYSNTSTALVSLILERAIGGPGGGGSVLEFARAALLKPLGIQDFLWEKSEGDRVTTASGLIMCTRDLAKIAWTMMDLGRWRGQELVPKSWVAESTGPLVPPSWPIAGVTEMRYGYLWFNGKLRGQPIFWGWGYGGQFSVAIPSLRLVVATHAAPPPLSTIAEQTNAIMGLVADIAALAS